MQVRLGVLEGHGDDDRQCSNWQKIYEYKMNSLEKKRELKGKRGSFRVICKHFDN